jgi:surfactin synthase thioesterase subunit
MKLICLPYAGASYYSYRMLENCFPTDIRTITLDLPGHGKRFREPLLTNISEMSEDLYHQIKPELNEPYALYCHSMGGLLAYHVCLSIYHDNLLKPRHLFVSGHNAPSVPINEQVKNVSSLSNIAFIEGLVKLGGVPEEVLKEKDLLELFMPILRADFKAVETYQYKKADFLIDVPITVMIGTDDILTSVEGSLSWRDFTSAKINMIEFTGAHFFIFDNWIEIAKIICTTLKKLTR